MKNKKIMIILSILIAIILISGVSVYATYKYAAGEVSYKKGNTEMTVAAALEELYASNPTSNYEEIKADAMNELKRILSPELLNRIDDVVVFVAPHGLCDGIEFQLFEGTVIGVDAVGDVVPRDQRDGDLNGPG